MSVGKYSTTNKDDFLIINVPNIRQNDILSLSLQIPPENDDFLNEPKNEPEIIAKSDLQLSWLLKNKNQKLNLYSEEAEENICLGFVWIKICCPINENTNSSVEDSLSFSEINF